MSPYETLRAASVTDICLRCGEPTPDCNCGKVRGDALEDFEDQLFKEEEEE